VTFMILRPSDAPASRNNVRRAIVAICLLLLTSCITSGANLCAEDLQAVSLPDTSGRMLALSACRGKVMLLDIFVTWSLASEAAIPGYSALYLKYHSRGLCMIGIALDDLGSKVVVPFAAGMEIPYPVLLANERVKDGSSPLGKLTVTPLLLLFDKSGRLMKVLAGYVDPRALEKLVTQLL